MPRGRIFNNSNTLRRSVAVEKRVRLFKRIIIRICQSYYRFRFRYIIIKDFFRYSEYDKINKTCNLAFPDIKLDKAYKTRNKFKNKIFEQRVRLSHLQKQFNQTNNKLARLGDREAQNIQELEKNKRLKTEKENKIIKNPEFVMAPEDLFTNPISPNIIAALEREFLQTNRTAAKAFYTF